jgi:hypothetical protein
LILTIPLFVSAIACGSEPAEDDPADLPADPSAPAEPASADSVVAWAEEIRAGIAALPGRVADDPDGARQRAVELYVTRQERIEQTSGPGTGSPADLAESVHEAEARFHELMQLLGETPAPDSTAVRGAVQALDARLAEVVDLAASPNPAGLR